MQKPQLTHDAAYKYSLWQKLWNDEYGVSLAAGESSGNAERLGHVLRIASAAVEQCLPRRTYEPCCLAGTCFLSNRPSSAAVLHTALHPGRRFVSPRDGCRDEDCFCLAHSAASVGGPVALQIRRYHSSPSNTRDSHRGLRCLLRHLPLQSVALLTMDNAADGVVAVCELRRLLARQTGSLNTIVVDGVAAPPPHLHTLLRAVTTADSLSALSLQHSALTDASEAAACVRGCRRLQSFSVRGSVHVRSGWTELAAAVAVNGALASLDVSECGWDDVTLESFLGALQGFSQRHNGSFLLDLSRNTLARKWWRALSTAPEAAQQIITGLALAENDLTEDAENLIPTVLRAYSSLRTVDVGLSTMNGPGILRLTRALSEDAAREWCRIDLQALAPLPANVLKRVTQIAFERGRSQLLLCGVNLRDCLSKANFSPCLARLSQLNLSTCRLRDEDLSQLAACIEKASPVPLTVLKVGYNELGLDKRKSESALSLLCKSLRSSSAPCLEELDFSHNGILLRPVLALAEQVSCTLRCLSLSITPIAEDAQGCTTLLSAIMRRQRAGGLTHFSLLDLQCVNKAGEFLVTDREVLTWLWRQAQVRFVWADE